MPLMTRPFNFSAGPAVLPEEVLQQAASEMIDWQGSGMSVMEMSHRGKEFISIARQAEADLREILEIPAHFKVLFMQGGAIAENAILPMNLSRGGRTDYVITGSWSQKSAKEARKYCDVHLAANGEDALHRLDDDHVEPCLILLDLSMPVMDGWEFLDVLRGREGGGDVPVTVLSANVDADVSRDLKARYGCRVLRKPASIDALLGIARTCRGGGTRH